MRIVRGIAIAIAIIGTVMLVAMVSMIVRQLPLILAGTATLGEVIAHEPSRNATGRTTYRLVVRFTAEHVQATIVSDVASYPATQAIGDAVRVVYNPERPSEAVIDTFSERWFQPLVLGILGIVQVAAAGFVLWRVARARRVALQR